MNHTQKEAKISKMCAQNVLQKSRVSRKWLQFYNQESSLFLLADKEDAYRSSTADLSLSQISGRPRVIEWF